MSHSSQDTKINPSNRIKHYTPGSLKSQKMFDLLNSDSSSDSNQLSESHNSVAEQKYDIKKRQSSLDSFMNALDGNEGPTYYSFLSLLNYLICGTTMLIDGSFCDTLGGVSKKILSIAGTSVYIADERIFISDVLLDEFPELTLFKIPIHDAFIESQIHPGIWIETKHFSNLHSLSHIRREIKKTGLTKKIKINEIVKILLSI